MSGLYLIWSNEHHSWWRPNSAGYTSSLAEAGRYTHDEALAISSGARDGWRPGEAPPEIPVLEADALACDAQHLADGRPLSPEEIDRPVRDDLAHETCNDRYDNVVNFGPDPNYVPLRVKGSFQPADMQLTTGDPRFDPSAPVRINGFLYLPIKGQNNGID